MQGEERGNFMNFKYAFKGVLRAVFEGFCRNVFLPAWYFSIIFKKAKVLV